MNALAVSAALPESLVVEKMVMLAEQFLPCLDPADQPLIIEIYGYMPERDLCAEICANETAYQAVQEQWRQRGINFSCRYVQSFLGVLYQWEESLEYEIHLSQV